MATPMHKKKGFFHQKSPALDGGSGMSAHTKRHFDRVKQKMFAFVDRQQRMEIDAMQQFDHQPMFLDQQRAPPQRSPHMGHRNVFTPALGHKQHHQPQIHKQLPHLALATPQFDRRAGRR